MKKVVSLRRIDVFEESWKNLIPLQNLSEAHILKVDNKSKIAIVGNSLNQTCIEFIVYHVTDRAKHNYQKPHIIENFIFENKLVHI